MWENETILSKGDLADVESYQKFIVKDYNGQFGDRQEHVEEMIERLQAELEVIEYLQKPPWD